MKKKNNKDRFSEIEELQAQLELKRMSLIEKGLSSSDPSEIMKAQMVLNSISQREKVEKKSFMFNPIDFQNSFGYKHRPTRMSYSMLSNMAKTPVINAVIRTRINQIANFSEPQEDKYSIGYEIVKRTRGEEEQKLSKKERKEIEFLTDFINNCGENNSFEDDDFDTFLRKISRDSLVFDQMTFEVVRNRRGEPHKFLATDASTFRVADSFDDDTYREIGGLKQNEIKGYFPNYVQIFQGNIQEYYYPWELCFGVRNPTSDINMNGYGISELEEMVKLITSMLHSDEYNAAFFKQGSAPKGILKVNGNFGDTRLQEFRQQWNATMRGVANAWKTPILEGDKVDWIDLTKSNKDMEFTNWVEYLIKISCAIYSIDPAEVNFPLSGGSQQQSLFEGSNEQRLKHSKDKGLFPLLKFVQKRINKFIISHFFEGKYQFRFVGIDAITPEQELKNDIQAVTNFMTLNEVRAKRGLPPIENGDIVLNSAYMQALQQASQASMFGGGGNEEPIDEEDDYYGNNETDTEKSDNPFEKSLNEFLSKVNTK